MVFKTFSWKIIASSETSFKTGTNEPTTPFPEHFLPGQNPVRDYVLHLVAMFSNTFIDLVLNPFQITVVS